MTPTTQHTRALLSRLANGWRGVDSHASNELLRLWHDALNVIMSEHSADDNVVRFYTDFSELMLNGMGNIPCILIGSTQNLEQEGRILRRAAADNSLIPCILCSSETIFTEAHRLLPTKRTLVLAPNDIIDIICSTEPLKAFCKRLKKDIPLLRLVPYFYGKPAKIPMFIGRETELDVLENQTDLNVVVAGPGRAGKTSLIQEYMRRAVISGEGRNIFYFDCQNISDSDTFARKVAMELWPRSDSHKLHIHEFEQFLISARGRLGGPIELILDEIDDLYDYESITNFQAFKVLRKLYGRYVGRIILGGRRVAMRLTGDPNMPFCGRLKEIYLGPIKKNEAPKLLVQPMNHMGIDIENSSVILDHVLKMTGCLPHLLQWYGLELSSNAIQNSRSCITMDDVQEIENRAETIKFFEGPLFSIEDARERLAALYLVKRRIHKSSLFDISQILDEFDVRLVTGQGDAVRQLCDDLVIRNILSWEGNAGYSLANDALWSIGQKTNSLDGMILTCHKELGLTP